jgi:acyl-CoA hydrolase
VRLQTYTSRASGSGPARPERQVLTLKKTSSESRLVISEVMMPHQANVAGNIHGGEIIKLMDSTAYATARRYARTNVVTARVDEVEFHLPIFIGDLVICTAQVVYVGHSSMEIVVVVEVEDLETEGKKRALTAFFTMIALDKKGRPTKVPELTLETEEEKRAFEEGRLRYERHKKK